MNCSRHYRFASAYRRRTSGENRSKEMAPHLIQSRGRQTDQSMSTSNYNSFYNIKKTRLSARYPFLPKKQIERKIKHLWERASAEKRATLCLASSGATAKSPFKGSILQGLSKKKVYADQIHNGGGQILNGSPASVGGKGHAHTLRSSIKSPHPPADGERVLRSSTKKLVSTRRVSFNLGQPSPSRPNNRSYSLGQKWVEVNAEKTKGEKFKKERTKREKSEKSKDTSQGHLKKRELSREEEKIYEFEDEGTRPSNGSVEVAEGRMTRLKAGAGKHVFSPEEYNLESIANSRMFSDDSQSPLITPGQRSPGITERRRHSESAQEFPNGIQTFAKKSAEQLGNPSVKEGKDKAVKKRGRSKDSRKGKKDDVPSAVVNTDTSQSDVDYTGEVPWMVSAQRDSSSDNIPDDSDDDDKEAVYDYYHKSSSESSAPTLTSLSQESEHVVSSPYQNDTMFSWNGVCFTKKSGNVATDTFDSQLSIISMDAAEVMSISSTEASLSLSSSPSVRGFLGFPGKLMTSSPQPSMSSPDNKEESLLPSKRKMHLRDEVKVESPISSRRALDADEVRGVEGAVQAPAKIVSPAGRKRKMRGQGGEEIVSSTSVQKTKENYDQTPVSSKKPMAPMEPSLMSSNQRNVLAEANSRSRRAAPTTNRTKREKEDQEPKMEMRRSGRMRNKEGLMNWSQTEEQSSVSEGGKDSRGMKDSKKASQINGCAEDVLQRDDNNEKEIKMSAWVKGRDEAFHSDGILCDLFQPNRSSQIRSFNPPTETEFYHQNLLDPVSSHLFLEENFFL